MATFKLRANELSGETGLKVYLYPLGGTIANSGGDTLTESSGLFTATVAESLTGLHEFYIGTTETNTLYRDFVNCEGNEWIGGAVWDAIKDKTDLIRSNYVINESILPPNTIVLYVDSTKDKTVEVVDADGNEINIDSITPDLIINRKDGTHFATIATTTSGNTFTFTPTSELIAVAREFIWALRDPDDEDEPVARGPLLVIFAAKRA